MNKKYKVVLFGVLAYALANEQYKQRKALNLMVKSMKDQNEVLEILVDKGLPREVFLRFLEEVGKRSKVIQNDH